MNEEPSGFIRYFSKKQKDVMWSVNVPGLLSYLETEYNWSWLQMIHVIGVCDMKIR